MLLIKQRYNFESNSQHRFEDIESLGFKQTIEDQYYKDDFELLIDDDLFIQIIKDDGFVFQGTIKNKSEFKKLLIQTGIINE